MLNRTHPKKDIALRLKQTRENAGYFSAEDFCEKNKLRLTYYPQEENGERAIKISRAERYCKLCDS